MHIKTHGTGIVEVYPFVDGELTRHNFMDGPCIFEVFPKYIETQDISTGKAVRVFGAPYTREEWEAYSAKLNEGMQKAFEIATGYGRRY